MKNILKKLRTKYATAEKSGRKELEAQCLKLLKIDRLKSFADAIPDIYLILNTNRQIVFANDAFLKAFEIEKFDDILGVRPGNAIGCENAFLEHAGCGTSEFCENCGAVNAILSGVKGKKATKECQIPLTGNKGQLDLMVWTTPMEVENENFIIFAVQDISAEKRKKSLENIFFHDIMNTVGGLRGFAEMLLEADDYNKEYVREIYNISEMLIEEIKSQKQLIAAENGELTVNYSMDNSLMVLKQIQNTYKNHHVAFQKNIEIDDKSDSFVLVSDFAILKRVLGNMCKNALEGSSDNESILIGVKKDKENAIFYVRNSSFIPRKVQLDIFKKNFSTKEEGRGLGTYSMKLLSEKYLKGKVTFSSDEINGTEFRVNCPINPEVNFDQDILSGSG